MWVCSRGDIGTLTSRFMIVSEWVYAFVINLGFFFFFFFQAEDGIRDGRGTGVQTCALPICVATHRFEWRAGGIGGGLVIAGDYPDLAAMYDPNLGRTENMPGRVKRDRRFIQAQRFPVGNSTNAGSRLQPGAQHGDSRLRGEVCLGSPGRVIAMGVGDDRAVHRLPDRKSV